MVKRYLRKRKGFCLHTHTHTTSTHTYTYTHTHTHTHTLKKNVVFPILNLFIYNKTHTLILAVITALIYILSSPPVWLVPQLMYLCICQMLSQSECSEYTRVDLITSKHINSDRLVTTNSSIRNNNRFLSSQSYISQCMHRSFQWAWPFIFYLTHLITFLYKTVFKKKKCRNARCVMTGHHTMN